MTSIAVRTEAPVTTDDEGFLDTSMAVTISIRLRDGSAATRSATCGADAYQFDCYAGDNTGFALMRAGERGITVRDSNFRKVDGDKNNLASLMGLKLGGDDRLFRLDERDDPLCRSR